MPRNAYVDRLRGISILMVLLGHSMRYDGFWVERFPKWLHAQIITSAIYGVTVFFVISGFLITSKFVRSGTGTLDVDMRNFYLQRIGRIVPPLLLLISASLVIALAMGQPFEPSKIARGLTYLLQLDFGSAATLIPHTESSYDPLWSLAIEEQFYVILPLLCLMLIRKRRLAVALLVFVVVGLLYRSSSAYSYSFFGAFDQIALGGVVAILAPEIRGRFGARMMAGLRIAGLVGLAVLYVKASYEQPSSLSIVAFCGALYIVGSLTPPAKSSTVTIPLESLGMFSYEIYLFHFMVLWALAPLALHLRSTDYFGAVNWFVTLAIFAIIYVIGLTVARFYSEPLNRLIRRRFGTATGGTKISDFMPPAEGAAAVVAAE